METKNNSILQERGDQNNPSRTHLTNGTVETSLHVVLAFVASVYKTVLALVMQLDQHTHGAPHGPPEGAKLKMFVPGQCKEGITAIHEVACHKGVGVYNWGQGICHGACNQPYHKEHLEGKNTVEQMKEMRSVNFAINQNKSYKISTHHHLIHSRLDESIF